MMATVLLVWAGAVPVPCRVLSASLLGRYRYTAGRCLPLCPAHERGDVNGTCRDRPDGSA